MRPLIGIPCNAGQRADNARPIYGNNRSYVHAVESAGGVPVLIPLLGDLEGLNSLLPRLDGLLLSGGIDIEPAQYGEEPHAALGAVDPHLDALELALARWAIEEDIPTLGICRGHQILNVARGGSLYQDLAAQYPGSLQHANWDKPRNTKIHRVEMEADSQFADILGTRSIEANSLHHQAIKKVGYGIRITGYSEDGVVEMIEMPDHRFMLGVQGHPEELYQDDPAWANLFRAFVDACTNSDTLPLLHTFAPLAPVKEGVGVGVV
jgi:putative glutamine amidotransferase